MAPGFRDAQFRKSFNVGQRGFDGGFFRGSDFGGGGLDFRL